MDGLQRGEQTRLYIGVAIVDRAEAESLTRIVVQEDIGLVTDHIDLDLALAEVGIEIASFLAERKHPGLEAFVIAMVENIALGERRLPEQLLKSLVVRRRAAQFDTDLADQYRVAGRHGNLQAPNWLRPLDYRIYIGVVIPQGLQAALHPLLGRRQEVRPVLGCFRCVPQPGPGVVQECTFQAHQLVLQQRFVRRRQRRWYHQPQKQQETAEIAHDQPG